MLSNRTCTDFPDQQFAAKLSQQCILSVGFICHLLGFHREIALNFHFMSAIRRTGQKSLRENSSKTNQAFCLIFYLPKTRIKTEENVFYI